MFRAFNQLRHSTYGISFPARMASSSKAQGKRPVQVSDEDSDYAIEEQPVQQAKASGKRKAHELTPAEYYELFKKQNFEGTRYPHTETMKELGIADDVEHLLRQCYISKMMHTPRPGYHEETIQFLSSLALHFLPGGMTLIAFRVFDHDYFMPMTQVETLFGFPSGSGTKQSYKKEELDSLWATIGYEKVFSSSRSKSSQIRSPVLRYFHKSLANVFFARDNAGTIVNGEMELMDMALKDLLLQAADGTKLVGDTTNTSLSYVLVHQLLSYKRWVSTVVSKGTTSTICLGGLVTVFLEAMQVPLQSEPTASQWIDFPYLQTARTLKKGLVNGKYVYNFIRPTFENSQILLPCEQLTSFSEPGSTSNIAFNPPEEYLHMTKVRNTSTSAAVLDTGFTDAPMEIEENQPEYSFEGYAPEQYYFDEFSEPRQGKGVVAAHSRANSLQKWNKDQDKLLLAQAKELKAHKKEIKSLKSRFRNFIKKFSCSSSSAALHTRSPSPIRHPVYKHEEQAEDVNEEQGDYMEDDQPEYEQPAYEEEEQAEYETEVQVPFVAPARHSSYQRREREYAPVPARTSAHEPREIKRRSVKKKLKRQRSTRREGKESSSAHPPYNP